MGTWRCPHCRTVQLEGPRCFLCLRSATSCGTCVNFRRSVVGGVGYCGLDRLREPLSGEERRPCWSDTAQPATGGLFGTSAALPGERSGQPDTVHGTRGLVELRPARPVSGS